MQAVLLNMINLLLKRYCIITILHNEYMYVCWLMSSQEDVFNAAASVHDLLSASCHYKLGSNRLSFWHIQHPLYISMAWLCYWPRSYWSTCGVCTLYRCVLERWYHYWKFAVGCKLVGLSLYMDSRKGVLEDIWDYGHILPSHVSVSCMSLEFVFIWLCSVNLY